MEDPIVAVTARTRQHLMTVQEFADHVRAHPRTIYRLIKANKQPGVVKVGGLIRINPRVALSQEY